MVESKVLKVVIVVLVAGILITSTLAAFFLYQYNQSESNASAYLSELNQAASATVLTTTSTVVNGGQTMILTSTLTGTQGLVERTNALIDFGNGTQRWYNGTEVAPGSNVYLATVAVTAGHLNDTWYPQYGEHLVNGIEGVQNSQSRSWFLWTYNDTSRWQVAAVGADDIPATNGLVFAWSYCGITASYAPSCESP